MSDAITMKTVDLQVENLQEDLHRLKKLPEVVKVGLLDDLQIVLDINGNPDPTQQMFKRVLFSVCRNSVQNHKQREEDAEAHQKDCVIASLVTYDSDGKPVMPWTLANKDGRNVEHEAWDANGRATKGQFKEKLRGVVLDNFRLILICVTVILTAYATGSWPSLKDLFKAVVPVQTVDVHPDASDSILKGMP